MQKNKEKEFVYEMTQKEYDEGLTKGWDADDMLSVGKHTFRRSRFITKRKDSKTKISLYIDGDILEYFRQRAESPNSAPYQTQINNELRCIMKADTNGKAKLEPSILEDTEFLRALKDKLETV